MSFKESIFPYYFYNDNNDICKQEKDVDKDFSEVIDILDLIEETNNLVEENVHLSKKLEKCKKLKAKRLNKNRKLKREITHLIDVFFGYKKQIKDLQEEKELIKEKLLNEIMDYDEISHDNYYYGLQEAVESLHENVEELFKNPQKFKMEHWCDDCKHFVKVDEEYCLCMKHNKQIDEDDYGECEDYKWRV